MSLTRSLLRHSTLPYRAPQFDQIEVQHYRPAFDEGVRQNDAEIEAIVQNPQALILPIRCWRLNKAALC